ncbi:MAG: hypothetical protein P4M05_03000, partial [Bradyrhizobium sp.]|nr:hypothetical protein [Bradyrhizobium sp.]
RNINRLTAWLQGILALVVQAEAVVSLLGLLTQKLDIGFRLRRNSLGNCFKAPLFLGSQRSHALMRLACEVVPLDIRKEPSSKDIT